MRRTRRTSGRYRGSRRGTGILIPILVVLCIVAAGALYFINENMTFTKEGRLFLPANRQEEVESVDANLVIEEPQKPAEEVPQTAQPEKSDEEKIDAVRGYFIPISCVKSMELFSAELENVPQGVNTLVLEVKAEDGTLAFGSDHEFVIDKQIVGDDGALSEVIEKAKSSGYKVALFVSCFKDNGAALNNFKHSVLGSGGGVWRDGNETRWLSPYSEESRLYLTDIIKKLSAFSSDEIILSNISFPVVGKTDVIAYDESLGTKRDMLKLFINEAKSAAGETPLSAVFENYNEKRALMSGQNPAEFQAFERIYMNGEASQYTLSFEEGKALFSADVSIVPVERSVSGEQFVIKQ